MIPSNNAVLLTGLEVEARPSKTYKLHIEEDITKGNCNEQEAMKQAIYKILNTERYKYIIYSWNYGIELDDLFGEPITYVIPELRRRIEEALLQDDRITEVDGFDYKQSNKRELHVSFTVHTIFGDIYAEKVVNY